MSNEVRFAQTVEEATHRFFTNIKWGQGYIANDGAKYIVAQSDREAILSFPTEVMHMQRKGANGWYWIRN